MIQSIKNAGYSLVTRGCTFSAFYYNHRAPRVSESTVNKSGEHSVVVTRQQPLPSAKQSGDGKGLALSVSRVCRSASVRAVHQCVQRTSAEREECSGQSNEGLLRRQGQTSSDSSKNVVIVTFILLLALKINVCLCL